MRYLVQLNTDIENTYLYTCTIERETDKCYYSRDEEGHEHRIRKEELGISSICDNAGVVWLRAYAVGETEEEAKNMVYSLTEAKVQALIEKLHTERAAKAASGIKDLCCK